MPRIEIEVVGHQCSRSIYRVAYAGEVLIDRDPGSSTLGIYAHGHHLCPWASPASWRSGDRAVPSAIPPCEL
jgi:hypothetical protein